MYLLGDPGAGLGPSPDLKPFAEKGLSLQA